MNGKKPVVLLINAPSSRAVYKEDRCQIDANELFAKFYRPPISLMILAGIAELAGYAPRILDCPVQGYSFKILKNLFYQLNPSVVIVNTSEQTEREDFLTLRLAKHFGARTIAFGYQASTLKKAFITRCPWVDIVIMKEPEMTFKEVLEGKKLNEIDGICYVDEVTSIMENQERPFISDLDKLPVGSHHLIDFTKYRFLLTGKPFTVIQISRGCPFTCNFCLAPFLNGAKFRKKSVSKVIDEIEYVVKKIHVSTFFLRADTFTLDKEWIRQFCQEIVTKGLRIQWFTNSRIDTIPDDLIPLMSAAGCMIIGIGIETGLPMHQRLLQKNIDLSLITPKLKTLKSSKIHSVVYFIIGHPFDNMNSIYYNINYSKTIPATFVEFTIYVDLTAVDLKHDKKRFPDGLLKKISKKGEVLFYFRLRKLIEIICIIEGYIIRNPSNFLYLLTSSARLLWRYLFR
nr:radical SAM protein [Candidatus Sigynarchaeum springense]